MCKTYALADTPFYKLRSKRKLADILFIDKNKFPCLCQGDERYRIFPKAKKNGKKRVISNPFPVLKRVQRRIADLLSRVKPAEFNYAFIPGRSYIDNAAQHIGSPAFHCLDIKDYFSNCSSAKAWWFFNRRLHCSPDVSWLLANIVTFKGSLPQGSPCSPILAYYCYMDMWEEIADAVKLSKCKLSVYADDITISGQSVPKELIWQVKEILRRYGHSSKKDKEHSSYGRSAEITGIIAGKGGLSIPNKQYKKLREAKTQFLKTENLSERKKLQARITGLESQIEQVRKASEGLFQQESC